MAAWGVAGTPGDPARGRSPIAVAGTLRILIECTLVGLATVCLWTAWSRAAAETMLTAFVLNYALTWERIAWLMRADSHGRVTRSEDVPRSHV